jgi:hypothetical protein
MMVIASTATFAFSLLLFLPMILLLAKVAVEEEISEGLLPKPLPDRKVLAHYLFQTKK